MKVFVTGASGFIGRAVVKELQEHGHQVTGLARSEASAEKLHAAGVAVLRGDLRDLDVLREGASASDGVIHLGFMHDDFGTPEGMMKATAADREAITVMAEAMSGSKKPLIISSGTLGLAKGQVSTEDTDPQVMPHFDRDLSTALIKQLSKDKDIRGMIMRFAPTVHGWPGDWGFIMILAQIAKKLGFVAYVGDGSARWTAVHRDDAAVLLRLAFEKGRAGASYLAVAEGAVPTKDTMTAIGSKLGLPVVSKVSEELGASHGFFAHALAMDTPADSTKTQEELGWQPKKQGIVRDIEENYVL